MDKTDQVFTALERLRTLSVAVIGFALTAIIVWTFLPFFSDDPGAGVTPEPEHSPKWIALWKMIMTGLACWAVYRFVWRPIVTLCHFCGPQSLGRALPVLARISAPYGALLALIMVLGTVALHQILDLVLVAALVFGVDWVKTRTKDQVQALAEDTISRA
ncbi:MAG: hypothetical protein AB8B51_11910 [Sedimentitalea sp.]